MAMVGFEFVIEDFIGHTAGIGRDLLAAIAATAMTKGTCGVVEGVGLVGFYAGARDEAEQVLG
jgi:hypothetical protein